MYQNFNEYNGFAVEDMPYVMLRGWALQCLMNDILSRPDWVDLPKLNPKAFQNKLLEHAMKVECDITPTFIALNPQVVKWLSGCFRILFKCLLHDWRMEKVLLLEPQLPTILLPDGREIRCGTPDIVGDSQAFDGIINVELKSGFKRTGKDNGKLARYNSGTSLFTRDNGINRPFRGTIWVSFASTRQNVKSSKYTWSVNPRMSYVFEPYNVQRISHSLQKKFGVDLETVQSLPRHYTEPALLTVPA